MSDDASNAFKFVDPILAEAFAECRVRANGDHNLEGRLLVTCFAACIGAMYGLMEREDESFYALQKMLHDNVDKTLSYLESHPA